MAEQIPNTTCKICGKVYYACKTCVDFNHWKAVACCPEHYAEYVDLVIKERNKDLNVIDEDKVVVEATDEDVEVKTTTKKNIRTKISEKNI